MLAKESRIVSTSVRPLFFQGRLVDYFALTKPGITLSVCMTTLAGFILATISQGSSIQYQLLFHTLLGTYLMSSGAAALNMLLENEEDALMERTKDRPLPAGRVKNEEAFLLGSFLASVGVVHVTSMVNLTAGFFGALTLALYLVFYTPLKKTSSFSTVIGSIAGALPPIIGYSAVKVNHGVEGWYLFLILFVWQLPHILALTWMYRDDYSKAGFKMSPLTDTDGSKTSGMALILTVLLCAVSLLPWILKMAGTVYAVFALLLGALFITAAIQFCKKKNFRSAKTLFLFSVAYIPLLLFFMIVGR